MTSTRNLAEPLESLVVAYGAEYGDAYRMAFAMLPDGVTTPGQQCRSEIAHWAAMDHHGFLSGATTFAGLASGYAQQQATYAAPNADAAARYADRVRQFCTEADNLTAALARP